MGEVWGGVSPPKSEVGLGMQSKAYQYAPQRLNPRNVLGKKVGWACPPQSTPWHCPCFAADTQPTMCILADGYR